MHEATILVGCLRYCILRRDADAVTYAQKM